MSDKSQCNYLLSSSVYGKYETVNFIPASENQSLQLLGHKSLTYLKKSTNDY